MKAVRETLSPHGRRRGKAGQAETLRHKGLPPDGTLESLGFNEDENRGISSDGGVPMGLSSFSYICITNNPALKGLVKHLEYMDASSLDVLKKGRALVHEGWELLASPSPTATSNRTSSPTARWCCGKTTAETAACRTHSRCPSSKIQCVSGGKSALIMATFADNIEKDFRYMDMILLEETFRQYGILTSPVKSYSEVVDK